MGWFDWFKKPEKTAEAPAVVKQDEKPASAVPTKAYFVAYLLDGTQVRHEAEYFDKSVADAAAKEWAATIEGAYSCSLCWDNRFSSRDYFKIGDKWPWEYVTEDYTIYKGVVSAPYRHSALNKIATKLREALGRSPLGRIWVRIGGQSEEYVDYNEITLP